MQQAEALVRIATKLESLDTDLRDTQQLIGALHGGTPSRHLGADFALEPSGPTWS